MPEHIQNGRYEYSTLSGSPHDDHLQLHFPHSHRGACKESTLHQDESDPPKKQHQTSEYNI